MDQGAIATRRIWRGAAGSLLLVLCAGLLLHAPAQAFGGKHGKHRLDAPETGLREPPRLAAGGAASADRIIEQIERRYRARVVRFEETQMNGRRVYVLRLLSDEGRVWTVRVDADTGGVL
jgi:hypothetical protein